MLPSRRLDISKKSYKTASSMEGHLMLNILFQKYPISKYIYPGHMRWCPILGIWAAGDWHGWPWGCVGLRCPPIPRAAKAKPTWGKKCFDYFVVCSCNYFAELPGKSCQELVSVFLSKFYWNSICLFLVSHLFPTLPPSHPDSLHYILWGAP